MPLKPEQGQTSFFALHLSVDIIIIIIIIIRTNIIFLPYTFLLISSSSISFRFFILFNFYTNKHKDCFTPSKHIQAGGVRQNRN